MRNATVVLQIIKNDKKVLTYIKRSGIMLLCILSLIVPPNVRIENIGCTPLGWGGKITLTIGWCYFLFFQT